MKLTPRAKKFWDEIPDRVKINLLNNVWCGRCVTNRGIGNIQGTLDGGDLLLKGVCTKCGGPVARLIEND